MSEEQGLLNRFLFEKIDHISIFTVRQKPIYNLTYD